MWSAAEIWFVIIQLKSSWNLVCNYPGGHLSHNWPRRTTTINLLEQTSSHENVYSTIKEENKVRKDILNKVFFRALPKSSNPSPPKCLNMCHFGRPPSANLQRDWFSYIKESRGSGWLQQPTIQSTHGCIILAGIQQSWCMRYLKTGSSQVCCRSDSTSLNWNV